MALDFNLSSVGLTRPATTPLPPSGTTRYAQRFLRQSLPMPSSYPSPVGGNLTTHMRCEDILSGTQLSVPERPPNVQQIFSDLCNCLLAMEAVWDVADSLDEERRHNSCSTCQDLPFRDKSWSRFYIPDYEDHSHIWFTKVTWRSLRLSSRGECSTCEFLFQLAEFMAESRNIRHDMLELISFKFGWQWWGGHGGLDGSNLHVEMNYESLTLDKDFRLCVTEGTKPPWPGIQVGRHLSLDRASPECVLVMKLWLSTCLESHPQCRVTSSTILPDRVLEISPSLDVQLVENFDQKIIGQYIALSHCWGGKVGMQLKSGNLEKFKQNILYLDLPKTFQHALRICKALDVHYIWIDSLCILQDSQEDWAMQGSKMAQIYSDCLITIAADAAGNSRMGFLRRAPDPDEFSVPYRKNEKDWVPVHELEDSEEYEVHFRRDVEVSYLGSFPHHYATPKTTKEEELGSHLSKRGWCLQESLLPNRVLHFAFDHLSWSCATDSFCECMYGTMDPAIQRYRSLLADGFEQGCIIDRASMKEDWQNIINEYTRRSLTFSSDRLAALAGLAACVHAQHPNVEYLAGLWSDTLPQSLLWTSSLFGSPEKKVVRVQPYIAPSWSWAGLTGSVGWAHQDLYDTVDQSKLKLVSHHCSPAGPNRYGALESAKLVVVGHFWRVKLLEVDSDRGFASVQILEEHGTASSYVLPIDGTWDVAGEIGILHEQDNFSEDNSSSEASSCPDESDSESDDSAGEEEELSGQENSDEDSSEDDSSSDDNGVSEADGEFALLNVLGFAHFLVLSRCPQDERPNTFQRVGTTSPAWKSSSRHTPTMSPAVMAMGVAKEVTLV